VDALDLLRGDAFPWAGPTLFLADMSVVLALVTGLALEALHHPEQFQGIDADQEEVWDSLQSSDIAVAPHPSPTPLEPSETLGAGASSGELERLLAFMLNHRPYLEPNLTLQDLAKSLRMSPKVLSKVINAELGRNFSEFINGYRIQAAKAYLDDPAQDHLPILDILFRVGFNAKSTFNWMFKRETGMTPSEYRAHRDAASRDVQDPARD
jgi:AraC-like DNA-binding protein